MSRSSRAWAKGCELVGAAARGVRRLGKLEARESLAAERLVRTASSLATLTWVATAAMLMLALSPALALGKSASRSSRAPAARAAQATSHARVIRTEQSSDPPQSGGTGTRRPTARVNVLAFGSGYASAHGSRAVRALQRRLTGLGYSPGPIDGRYGPLTDAAVIRFQAAHGLVADGIDGPSTTAALASAKLLLYPGDGYVPGGSGPVRALQRHLAAAGFRPGPIDGRYGPLTERAVIRFQTAHHLHVDGIAGPQTLGQLRRGTQPQVHQRPHPRTTPRQVHRRPRPSRPSTKPASPPRPVSPPKTAHHARPASGPSLDPVADRHRLPDPGGAGGTAVAWAPAPRKSTASSTERADPTPNPSRAGPVPNPGRGARGGARSGGLGVSSSRGRRVQVRTPARGGRQSRPCRGCVSSG